MQDILNTDGNFLSFQEFQNKFNLKTNYIHYFQLMAAIPPDLKKKAKTFNTVSHALLESPVSFSSTGMGPMVPMGPMVLTKMRCKYFYKIFNENCTIEPTGIKVSVYPKIHHFEEKHVLVFSSRYH